MPATSTVPAKNPPAAPKSQQVKVTISATRLGAIASRTQTIGKSLSEIEAQLAEMLFGKDESRSPIVSQVRELKDLVATIAPAVAELPNRIDKVTADVRDML